MILHSKPWITKCDIDAVSGILRTGHIGNGVQVVAWEKKFSTWMNCGQTGIAVGSGTAALELCLLAIGVGLGDEVILPSYTCRNVLLAVQATKATPILCDVGEDWVVTSDQVAGSISGKTKAIIVPHMFGIFADTQSILSFKIPVIEDFAQAVDEEKKREILGCAATYSFHPTKCLTTAGGGMAMSPDPTLVERMRCIYNGRKSAMRAVFSPMSDMSAVLGMSQLERYSGGLGRRRAISTRYLDILKDILPESCAHLRKLDSMLFRFPVRAPGGIGSYRKMFDAKGVHVRQGVDFLLHRELGLNDERFPVTIKLFSETVTIPIYPALTGEELDICIGAMRDIFTQKETGI